MACLASREGEIVNGFGGIFFQLNITTAKIVWFYWSLLLIDTFSYSIVSARLLVTAIKNIWRSTQVTHRMFKVTYNSRNDIKDSYLNAKTYLYFKSMSAIEVFLLFHDTCPHPSCSSWSSTEVCSVLDDDKCHGQKIVYCSFEDSISLHPEEHPNIACCYHCLFEEYSALSRALLWDSSPLTLGLTYTTRYTSVYPL